MNNSTKKLTRLAVLCTLALITFMVENLLPPLLAFAPGTKLGFASIFVNLAFLIYGKKEAFLVLGIKCLLGAVFTGNIFSLYYSIPAGAVSLLTTILLFKSAFPKISVITVSVAAAIMHNAVQIIMAAILFNTMQIVYYIPLASIAGFLAGIFTGLCLYFIIKYIPKKILTAD